MYTLLVVDDEKYAVQGITRGINWSDIHIDEIFEVYDAIEAMDILKKNHVDVMITDIKMPGCDGLELQKWVRDNTPNTVTIFLSGYADFTYAQKALQFGSFDYLLKPVDHEQLKKLVKVAIGKIEKDKEAQGFNNLYQMYLKRWESHLPILIEDFWMDVLENKISLSAARLEFIISQYKIPLGLRDKIIPILISIEGWKEELNTKDEEVMSFAVKNVASDILIDGVNGNIIGNYKGTILALIYNSGEMKKEVNELQSLCRNKCQQFIKVCDQLCFSVVSCYIGEATDIHSLGNDCHKLLEIENSNVKSSQKVFYEFGPDREEKQSAHVSWPQDLNILFELGKKDELVERVNSLFADLEAREHVTRDTLEEIYYGMNYMMYHNMHRKNLDIRKYGGSVPCEDAVRSLSRFKWWALRALNTYFEYIGTSCKAESAIINKIKQYISDHMCEEFTREDIARSVFLNPAYLSRTFKSETGLSLSDYIVQTRMEHAKDMLTRSNLSVSVVAEEVGYFNFSHFSKMFRRYTGITPSEYRKKYHIDDE